MSRVTTLLETAQLTVLDGACRHPRSAPTALRGGEPAHLALVRRGAFTYHLGRRFSVADPCTALLHRPGWEYRVGHPGDGGDDGTVISLSPELLEELFGPGGAAPRPEIPLLPGTQLLHARVHSALARGGGAGALDAAERVLELLQGIAGDRVARVGRGPGQPVPRPVARARELLAARPAENLSLESVAAESGCSPFHLMRLFRSETGRSLRAYRRELRVLAALPRLADGERDLAGLALDLGFSHHSHLSESFRRVLGMAPSRARAELERRRAGARS